MASMGVTPSRRIVINTYLRYFIYFKLLCLSQLIFSTIEMTDSLNSTNISAINNRSETQSHCVNNSSCRTIDAAVIIGPVKMLKMYLTNDLQR